MLARRNLLKALVAFPILAPLAAKALASDAQIRRAENPFREKCVTALSPSEYSRMMIYDSDFGSLKVWPMGSFKYRELEARNAD